MFDTLKIYINKIISLEEVKAKLIELGYKNVDEVFLEGDFSLKGDTLEVFPTNFNFPLRIEWEFEHIGKIYSFDKKVNKKITDYDFIIIIPYIKKIRKYSSEELPLDTVLRIQKGDYVVHTKYGIGIFKGVKKLKVIDKEDYYFEIEYENKDKIYVPREEAHFIQKYTSFSNRTPKITNLNSKEWIITKEKVKNGIREFALELLKLEAQRRLFGGFSFSKDTDWQKEFEEKFIYEETEDQLKAIQEVKADMESNMCMDRLVCGDVGYGKTEVAARAAFKAVMSSKQVAFLVPTTVLAYQHYYNFKKRIENFPVNVEMLSRFRSISEQKKIIKDIREGKVDIVIGTHRLLSDDVVFKDLGLLIIDDEHRFGVEHKEKIKKLKVGIDVLVLSATPIPRTLYMSLIGIKDISVIRTPPPNRLPIKTKIIEFSPKLIANIITSEVNRGGQVFFINNRIATINKIANVIKKYLPEYISIGITYGRLPPNEIEKTMVDFMLGKIDCLFSTAIVESGIDVPKANTIIINNAHMFGLADLHQLRGRVGRFNIQAYAYLVVPKFLTLSKEMQERLSIIEKFSHLGSGFEIATNDLEMRGAGNILGKEQHGFIWMIGFDLYCRFLKKEVEYLKETFKIN